MDAKEQQIARTYHAKLATGEFDELDVYGMLILLREHAAPRTAVFEFANFVAHRERDRGEIHAYLTRTRFQVLEARAGRTYAFTIAPVFTIADVRDSVTAAFQPFALAPISDKEAEGILLCVMSLLQGVRLVDAAGDVVGKLDLAVPATDVELTCVAQGVLQAGVGLAFHALAVPNRGYTTANPQHPWIGLVRVRCSGGQLTLV